MTAIAAMLAALAIALGTVAAVRLVRGGQP